MPLSAPDRSLDLLERSNVLRIGNVLDLPAVRLEALPLVVSAERERGRAVDRDPVVVVEVDELAEPIRIATIAP